MSTRQVNWTLILSAAGLLLGWAFLGLGAYAGNDKALEHRISVVETKQESSDQRLERLEGKIDRILERVSR